ncbi:uncharacterized protein LOC143910823 [Arctopsyche grandis]|uniref:uncharacterized protein LOC143910823 n=1 Tax=Arctopsyche grandis TaxID=121162 RepID=UPI00406D78EA
MVNLLVKISIGGIICTHVHLSNITFYTRLKEQQSVALPPHLLRQYLAQQQERGRPESTPIYEQEQQQQYVQSQQPARPAAPRPQPQYVQYTQQPQPQQQQQYVPQPQPQAYRPKPQARPQQLEEEQLPEDYDPNPSYQFGFDVNDDQFTNYQNRKEERQGGVIKGSYSVVDSDGFIRTVTYTADPKEGFKAEVVRKPTDIVVKVPTPAPALAEPSVRHQQAAQYLQASSPANNRQQAQQPQQQQYYRYQ